jgi:hypothetical protein
MNINSNFLRFDSYALEDRFLENVFYELSD